MSGIVGWVDWVEDLTHQRLLIEHMAETLNHRGPDAKGSWLSSHAALAHRRLTVVNSLDGETLPMVYTAGDHTYVLTCDGEIYNFRELRSELEVRGHTFRTQSDTEVLLHSYIEWGEDCVQHLNGSFAFGLWDGKRQQLLLARDRLGVKPLFYAQRGNAILFASELKALLAHPLVKAEIGEEGLAEIFRSGSIWTPGCPIYRDVYELRPAHMLICTCDNTRLVQYWSLRSAPHTDDLLTTLERIQALLEDTIRCQMIPNDPLVTLLSGGLDSSGLTALAAHEMKREGKTLESYCIDFVDSAQHFHSDALRPALDAPWAQRVSDYLGSKLQIVPIDTDELLENLLVSLRAFDLPGTGQLQASLYLLLKAAKKNAIVALAGEGANEVFGGYGWFHSKDVVAVEAFPWDAMVAGQDAKMREKRYAWLSKEVREKIQLEAYNTRRYQEAIAEVPRLEEEDAHSARMRELVYLNLTRFLPMRLDRQDRMGKTVGFEVRVPYCDYRLVEYVWNIPWEMKTVGNIEKGILRQTFADVLPDDVRNRRKSGFPSSQNPSYLQAVQDWALHILDEPNSPILPLIDTGIVRAIAEGKMPIRMGDWKGYLFERIIHINTWLEEYHVTVR